MTAILLIPTIITYFSGLLEHLFVSNDSKITNSLVRGPNQSVVNIKS
jgi:hypothetical protein